MAIAAFTGLFGSGKTALASFMATELAANSGRRLWANYELEAADPILTVGELYDCRGGFIVLDELQGTIHSRTYAANMKTGFLEWFDQCRKQGNELFIIWQELAKVDVIVREMVNYLFSCEDLGNNWSKVKRYQRKPELGFVPMGEFSFDRRRSWGLYDHTARAWKLEAGDLPESPAAKKDREKFAARGGKATAPVGRMRP